MNGAGLEKGYCVNLIIDPLPSLPNFDRENHTQIGLGVNYPGKSVLIPRVLAYAVQNLRKRHSTR
jgi:hypothetical protein